MKLSQSACLLGACLFGAGVFASGIGCGASNENASMDDILVPASAMSTNPYGEDNGHHTAPTSTGDSNSATADMDDNTKDQLRDAIKRGSRGADQCGKIVPNAKTFGDGEVQVTFDGKTGHVTKVEVGAPFGGSELEKCIQQAFSTEYSLTFKGEITIPGKVSIASNAPPVDPKKPKK